MTTTNHTIKIEQCQRYTTIQRGVTVWQDKMLRRLDRLFNSGDGEFIVRKRGDEITICRIGKPEVVKE